MKYLKNLKENEFNEVVGEVYFSILGKYIEIEIEEDVPQDYIEQQVQYLNSIDEKILREICINSIKFCKEEMKDYPEKEYARGLYDTISEKNIMNFMDIRKLRIDMYEDEDDKQSRVLNLSGSCEWDKENGIQWLIKNDEIIYVGRWEDLNIWYSDVNDPICNYVIR